MKSSYSLQNLIQSSIRLKMMLLIVLPIILVTSGAMWLGFRTFNSDSRNLLENYNVIQAEARAKLISSNLSELEALADVGSNYLSTTPELTEEGIFQIISANLELNPLVFGSAVAFESFTFAPDLRLYSPYVYRANGGTARMDIGDVDEEAGYDYTSGDWEWWTRARRFRQAIWTQPYFDEGAGNVLMSTYSVPFYRNGSFGGVITVDILLESIFRELGLESSQEYILTREGSIIFSNNPEQILSREIFEFFQESDREDILALLSDTARLASGNRPFINGDGVAYWGIFSQIPETGWVYVHFQPENEALAFISTQATMFTALLIATLLLLIVLIWFITRKITNPVTTLLHAAHEVTTGNFNVSLPPESSDELGQLSSRFRAMISVLGRKNSEWERQLTERTAQLSNSEEKIRQQKTIIEQALNGIDIGIVMYDRDLNILSTNKKLIHVLDISEEEFGAFRNFREFMEFMMTEKTEQGFNEKNFNIKVFDEGFHSQLVTFKSGRIIEIKSSPVNQEIFIRSFEDVTAREHSKQELEAKLQELDNTRKATLNMMQDTAEANEKIRQSENKIKEQLIFQQALLDTLPNPVFYKGADQRYLGVNKAYEDTFDVKAKDLIGKSFLELEFLPEEFRIHYQKEDEEIISTLDSRRYETEMIFKDGEIHHTLYFVSAFAQSDGKPGGLIGTFTDITEQKETAKQLEIAKEAAESATQAKANFLASMSHEIRTPMNAVIGMVDLLRQTELSEDQQTMLQTVSMSGQSLLSIINDILDLSKIESGRFVLERISFSLAETIEGAANTVSINALKKGLGLIIFIDPHLPEFVLGDPVRIRQILINLIGNAIKFTEKGAIYIRAEPGNEPDPGNTIRLSVKDEGIGISGEAKQNLFKEFTQAESSTTRKYGGTGLGLSICKRLTEIMGGTIGVDSELGKGSEFVVTLDLETDTAINAASNKGMFKGINVLLVEMENRECQALVSYLEFWEATSEVCISLNDAELLCTRALEKGRPFDIVMLGSEWPRGEKFELANRITANGKSNTKIIAMVVGKRTRPRIEQSNALTLDVVPLTRTSLIQCLSIALGRASPSVHYKEIEDIKAVAPALSVEDAVKAGTLILVAEDNATNRDVIYRQLTMLGYTSEMTEDGKQALAAWQSGRYAILLTDCHMPEMDGFELTSAIREIEAKRKANKRFPIVAITANALAGEAERCLAAGMDGYMSKPIDIKELRKTLTRYITLPVSHTAAKHESAENQVDKNPLLVPDQDELPIDPAVLKDMFDNDDTCREILSDFMEPSRQIVNEILEAWETGSANGVGNAAHKLKSAARSVGANTLADLCFVLETAGKENRLHDVEDEKNLIISEMEKVATYINSL